MNTSNSMTPTPSEPPTPCTAHASVLTETAARYVKQLVAHLGRKIPVHVESEETQLILEAGKCRLVARDNALELTATSDSIEGLNRVTHVIGSHLERFGRRDRLMIHWNYPH